MSDPHHTPESTELLRKLADGNEAPEGDQKLPQTADPHPGSPA